MSDSSHLNSQSTFGLDSSSSSYKQTRLSNQFSPFTQIKLVNIHPVDIVDGNEKIILALVWVIILHFFVAKLRSLQLKQQRVPWSSLSGAMQADESSDLFDPQALLDELSSRFDLQLNSLKRDFADGWQILHIIDTLQPGANSVAKGGEIVSDHKRLEFALNRAQTLLGIRQIIDANDIRQENLEKRSLTIYLYQFLETASNLEKFDLKSSLKSSLNSSLNSDKCDLIRRFVDKVSISLANNNGLGEFKHEYIELRPIYERLDECLGDDYLARWMAIENEFRRDKELFKLKLEKSQNLQGKKPQAITRTITRPDQRSDAQTVKKLAGVWPPVQPTVQSTIQSNIQPNLSSQLNFKLFEMQMITGREYLQYVAKRYSSMICRLTVLISFSLCSLVLLPLLPNRIYFCRC